MSPTHSHARPVPRAGVDPIVEEPTALALLLTVVSRPWRHETVLVLLDGQRRGIGVVVVSDTSDPDDVIDVADRILDPAVHDGRVEAVIVASVRPTPAHPDDSIDPLEDVALGLDDAGRWLELDAVVTDHGVELVEWLVVTGTSSAGTISRPRDLVDPSPRW